ncbi:MAG: GNAT family N-acetyltransferase [Lachnospirales bacterium]|nr:GNAT family N-acetyltransferase [Clostridiales bacterium]
MIRIFNIDDLDNIMNIWLNNNIKTHNFIDKNYWINNFDYVKTLLPTSEIYVYEINNSIIGFIGINKNYIEGIFIKEEYQNKGVGSKLLNYIKNLYNELYLNVYKNNDNAIEFYKKHNFNIIKEKIDENTNEIELVMQYKKES